MSWIDLPLIGFDTETTGVNPEQARIVTACVGIGSRDGWVPRNWLIQQDQPIPEQATEIHGITTEQANEHGTPPTAALQQIRNDLYRAWDMRCPIVAYNAVYDLTVLDRELRRHDLGGLEIRGPVIDPLVIDKAIDRYRRGSRKLIDVAAIYAIALAPDEAHGAEPDARTAARLAYVMGKRATIGGQQLHDISLDELTTWQAGQYATQQESFAAYRQQQGNPLTNWSTDWPLRHYDDCEVAA